MRNENLKTIWEKRIKHYKESGLSMNRWCKDNDIKVHQLYYWLKKFNNEDSIQQETERNWLPVTLENKVPEFIQDDPIIIKIGKCTVDVKLGFNPIQLSEIIKVLSTLC